MDKGESVSEYVGRCLEVIDASGLEYRLGPMGTCIEGEFDDVMAVINKVGVVAGSSRHLIGAIVILKRVVAAAADERIVAPGTVLT